MTNTLKGLRVLNTRPKKQAKALTDAIIKAGGTVIACPTLDIKARSKDWVNTLPTLSDIDLAIFVSANAVSYCFDGLKQHGLAWPKTIKVVAIGISTKALLNHYGVEVHELPTRPDSEHLLALDCLKSVTNQQILLVKGLGGRPLIEDELKRRGAKTLNLDVYERLKPKANPKWINSIWQEDLVDIILITSVASLNHLLDLFGEEAQQWLESKTYCVVSERLAKAAAARGLTKLISSHPNHLMDALFDYTKGLTHG